MSLSGSGSPQPMGSAKLLPSSAELLPSSSVTLELERTTVENFTKLESKFAILVSDVKSALKEKVTPSRLHSYLEERLAQPVKFRPTTSIADLFKRISPYYCFINITLLKNIIDEFIGEPLQCQLDKYEHQLDVFTSTTEIALLAMINSKCQLITEGVPLVILKLAGRCLRVTIKRFQELVNHIFEKKSSALSNIRVEDGCICITWNTHESAVSSLVALAKEKLEFMGRIGVVTLTIGEITIFEQTYKLEEEEEEEEEENLHAYEQLIKCLRESGLEAVADDIAERTTEQRGKPVHSTYEK